MIVMMNCFLRNGWTMKGIQLYFHLGPLSEILSVASLRQAAGRTLSLRLDFGKWIVKLGYLVIIFTSKMVLLKGIFIVSLTSSFKTKYWKMDQVKFLEDSLWKICRLGRPYPFKFFKGCLPQILLGPFLNTWTYLLGGFKRDN